MQSEWLPPWIKRTGKVYISRNGLPAQGIRILWWHPRLWLAMLRQWRARPR